MKKVLFTISVALGSILLFSCNTCPDRAGNYVQLTGAVFDTLYDEVLFLPADITEEGDPQYYNHSNRVCRWCLPIDINHNETTYILRGTTRTDTIWLTYNVVLNYMEDNCGYQATAVNLQVASTYTAEELTLTDNELNTWRLWVEL